MMGTRRAVIVALHGLNHTSRMFKQADALHTAGFDVTVIGIVTRPGDPVAEEHPFGRVIRVRTTRHLHVEHASARGDVARAGGPGAGGMLAGIRMFMGRMKDNVLLASAASGLAPEVILASDLLAWAAGYLTKRRTHAPLILDVRDLVLDAGSDYPRTFAWLLRRLEAFVIHRGDAVVTVSEPLADVLDQRYPRAPRAIAIYSGAFECVDHPEPVHTPLRLFFQGQFAADRRLDELIEAMACVRDLEVTLTLQGFGGVEDALRKMTEDLDLSDRVSFIEPCDRRDVVRSAAGFDVGVINPRGDSLNYRVAVPAKLIDYIAAGLAVLASDLPGFRSIIEPARCGLLFEATGVHAIETGIRRLAGDPALVAQMKQNAVKAAPRYLATFQEERLVEVVDRVTGRESRQRPEREGAE